MKYLFALTLAWLTVCAQDNVLVGTGTTKKINGTLQFPNLTPSLPFVLDSSGNSTARSLDLSSGDVSGTVAAARIGTFSGDVTTAGASYTTTIAAGAVTLAKQASIATGSIMGRNTAGTGVQEVLTTIPSGVQDNITRVGTIVSGTWNGTAINLSLYASGTLPAAQFPALSGDVTTPGGSYATTLATTQAGAHNWLGINTFTNTVNFPNITAGSVARIDGSGNLNKVTIGTGLSFDGTTLSSTASGGTAGTMVHSGSSAAFKIPVSADSTGTNYTSKDILGSTSVLVTTNSSGFTLSLATAPIGVEFSKSTAMSAAPGSPTATALLPAVPSGLFFLVKSITIETTEVTKGLGSVPTFSLGHDSTANSVTADIAMDESISAGTYQVYPDGGVLTGGPKSNAHVLIAGEVLKITWTAGTIPYTSHAVTVTVTGVYHN